MVEGALGIDRVVEDDRVDDQAERAQLFLLALAVGLAQFAAAAVADVAGEAVAAFAAVELDEDAPPELLVVAVVEEVNRLWGSSDVLQRPGERREMARLAAQRANELARGGVALEQAAGDPEHVVVVLADQLRVDLVPSEPVQRTVVRRVQAPERGGAGVREARGVSVAEQAVEREHDVGVAGGVGRSSPRAARSWIACCGVSPSRVRW